ncbi:hypothetical protein [Nocardia sp. SSK8]|uniref:hypothetical protein n=1 Tax=Nocardia sp. SSK8 TaxID=3120154 RepID=UPI00300A75F2
MNHLTTPNPAPGPSLVDLLATLDAMCEAGWVATRFEPTPPMPTDQAAHGRADADNSPAIRTAEPKQPRRESVSDATKTRVAELTDRAAHRSLGIRRAPEPPYGWELYSPFRVICHGSLDNIADWLSAAEGTGR